MALLFTIQNYYYIECDEENLPRELLSYIQGYEYKKRNLWYSVDEWKKFV